MTDNPEKPKRAIARKRGQKIAASEIDKLIGMRIRIARNMAGKKQDELARYLGLTLQQTQKYENGKNKISVSILAKVAKYFHIPISYFIPTNGNTDNASAQTIKMLESVDEISLHSVAESTIPIKQDKQNLENEKLKEIENIVKKIYENGLEGKLQKILQDSVNSNK